MNRNQIITIVTCAVLCVGVYVFTDIRKPKADKPVAAMPKPEAGGLDIEEYVAETAATIANDTLRSQIEKQQEAGNYLELAKLFAKVDKPLAVAYSLHRHAQSTGAVADWLQSGDYATVLMQTAPDNKARNYLSTTAINSYAAAVAIDSTNNDNRIRLAGAYMEDGTQPMQGVGILLDVVKTDSNNVDALLMLGQYGIISGQYDKAIARLEKILYLQPQNSQALLMLAEAHNNMGNKQKALELLEQCKKTVSNPELKSEIDKYIENIKKPS